MKVLATFVR